MRGITGQEGEEPVNGILENQPVVLKFNIRLKLANTIPPDKQWWAIEGALARAEALGPTPTIKQVADAATDSTLVFFAMTEEQREDFLNHYAQPKGEAA